MKLLLDTHIILWALTDDARLSAKAKDIILSSEDEIFYSVAIIWEISIKHMQHPEHMSVSGRQLAAYCQAAGYHSLPVKNEHVYALETLKRRPDSPRHNDPFDRIMLAQAKAENMYFLSHDTLLTDYQEKCLLNV